MRLILRPKQGGKTTELINLSAENGGYIVCHTRNEAYRIRTQAREMGLFIPLPLTYIEFFNRQLYPPGVKRFLIDNVEMLLQFIARDILIEAVTCTPDILDQSVSEGR